MKNTQKGISRPTDAYSPDWPLYWSQNPGLKRGVGADATEDDDDGDGNKGGDKKPTPKPKDDPNKTLQERIDALEANNAQLLQEKKDAKRKADDAATAAAKANGDIEALELSWTAKNQALMTEIEEYQGIIGEITVGATASSLSSSLALPGSEDVLRPHIEKRLTTEIKGKKASLRILDKDGKPSAMTIDELRAEITGDKRFAPILVGSKASGPGAHRTGGNGEALNRSKMTAKDKADYQTKHGQEAYLRLPK